MSIEACFIPCAGMGSRMGPWGRLFPKPLWSIYEASMLEIQIKFAKSLGIKKIIINSHHLSTHFEYYNKKKNWCIEILFEEELLGSGGNIHNLKKNYPSLKNILILNPDIFIMGESQLLNYFSQASGNHLLLMRVKKKDLYNEVRLDESGYFENVITHENVKNEEYLTYSGVGLIELNSFEYREGKSSFFDTVVNKSLNLTGSSVLQMKDEYWDFGTLELYKKGIKSIAKLEKCFFRDFLINHNALLKEQLTPRSYKDSRPNHFDFLNNPVSKLNGPSVRFHDLLKNKEVSISLE